MKDTKEMKLHRNSSFTNYYFNVPDTTGTQKGMMWIGRKHEPISFDIADKMNKRIDKEFNQGKFND